MLTGLMYALPHSGKTTAKKQLFPNCDVKTLTAKRYAATLPPWLRYNEPQMPQPVSHRPQLFLTLALRLL